ncbi:MAG: glycosyltransferase family 4 protein [Actinomycetota bacterium]
MRVLLACPYDWDAPGGVQTHIRQLARELTSRGHEISVVAPGRGRARERWAHYVARPFRIPYRGTIAPIGPSPYSTRAIKREIEWFKPDLVHAHEPLVPSTAMYATLGSPVPVVATFHAFAERSMLLSVAAPLLRPVWRRLSSRVAVSQAAAKFVSGPFAPEPRIVPNGVDVRMFANAESAGDLPPGRRLLWVNRLDPQKGFQVALEAFRRLSDSHRDLSFVVAGDGPDRNEVRSLPGEVSRRVVMLGNVRHEDLPSYYAAADAFVAPALGQESFGIVLLEAMAAGVPVVASDIEGLREVVRDGETGKLVSRGDPAALADAVDSILSDGATAARLVEAGRRRADEFDWAVVAGKLEDVYREAAG